MFVQITAQDESWRVGSNTRAAPVAHLHTTAYNPLA